MLALTILSLAALAAGSPMAPYVRDLSKRQSLTVTSDELDDFEFYAQYAAAAYCNSAVAAGTPITCGGASGECPTLETDGVTAVSSFQGVVTGIGAYLAIDDVRGEIVLAVQGSNNIRNWIADAVFNLVACDLAAGCETDDGFTTAWDEISAAVTAAVDSTLAASPGYRVVVSGHSLGAAVGTLAGANLRLDPGLGTIDIYTYGSPRVGNAVFADFVDGQAGSEWRVTHLDDPVPRLPPIVLDYYHTSPEYWLDDGTADTVSYGVGDIEVCPGIANISCNAGTGGFDIEAHLHYFEDIAGCAPPTLEWKRQSDVSDEELADRLSSWAEQDRAFVTSS